MSDRVEKLLCGVDNEKKRAEFKECTLEEIDDFIARCPNDSLRTDATSERQKKLLLAILKPRSIDRADLTVGAIGAVASIISAAVAIIMLIRN
jgi:hypothetical protein